MPQDLAGKRVLAVIAPEGFRDEELAEPKRALEARGAKVVVGSTRTGTASGMLGASVAAEKDISMARADHFDAVFFVGGQGSPTHLWNNTDTKRLAREAHEQGKPIGAICLSGAVLAQAGILKGKRATVFETPDTLREYQWGSATYVKGGVVVDENIVTGAGPGDAPRFGEELAKLLAAAAKPK